MGTGRKEYLKNCAKSASNSIKSSTSGNSSKANCIDNSKVVKGKVCVLGSLQGDTGETASLLLLRAGYINGELMLFEDDPNLSSCDRIIINGHSDVNKQAFVFPGNLDKGMSPEGLKNYLESHGYNGSEVVLASCNLGATVDTDNDGIPDSNFAQNFSNELNKDVIAYPHLVQIFPSNFEPNELVGENQINKRRDGHPMPSDGCPIPFKPEKNLP